MIKTFVSWNSAMAQKFYAEGRCWEKTEEFVAAAMGKHGWDVRAVSADNLPEYKKYGDAHWIVWVNGINIDFTARQFHPSFAFPRIWRGGHGCVLAQMTPARKDYIGVDARIDAWEYLPK